MFLIINTVVRDELIVALANQQKIIARKKVGVGWQQAEKLLVLIDKLLSKNKVKPQNLKGIIVVSGPGGFTSVRLGVIVANTLSYSLQIPNAGLALTEFKDLNDLISKAGKKLKGRKGFRLIQPIYGREPNITKKSKFKNQKSK